MINQEMLIRTLRHIRCHVADIPKTRLGSPGDGGYVINNDLKGLDAVLSIGIGGEVSFDKALADMGLKVFQYDPTVPGPPIEHPNFVFRAVGWGNANTATQRTLEGMLEENGLKDAREVLLKFDVEGAEWDALMASSLKTMEKFRIITAEFHDLPGFGTSYDLFLKGSTVFSMLAQNHFVTHVHPNNCCGVGFVHGVVLPSLVELTYLRKDRANFLPSNEPIPSALDFPNVANNPEIVMSPFAL